MTDDKDKNGELRRPGGVKHDERGNAVWQWAAAASKHALDSTSALLRKLDVPGLKVEDDKSSTTSGDDDAGASGKKSSGYNPYGSSHGNKPRLQPPAGRPGAKATPKRATASPAQPVKGDVSKSSSSFLRRLFRKD